MMHFFFLLLVPTYSFYSTYSTSSIASGIGQACCECLNVPRMQCTHVQCMFYRMFHLETSMFSLTASASASTLASTQLSTQHSFWIDNLFSLSSIYSTIRSSLARSLATSTILYFHRQRKLGTILYFHRQWKQARPLGARFSF